MKTILPTALLHRPAQAIPIEYRYNLNLIYTVYFAYILVICINHGSLRHNVTIARASVAALAGDNAQLGLRSSRISGSK